MLNTLLSVGAGFMLAAAILEVIPRSVALNESAAVIILAGYLFVHLVEHTIATHFHFGEETHLDQILGPRAAYSALGGLVLHTFFDGALIAAGFWVSMHFGMLMFLAIVLHKIPEGFTAASIMRASGRSSRRSPPRDPGHQPEYAGRRSEHRLQPAPGAFRASLQRRRHALCSGIRSHP